MVWPFARKSKQVIVIPPDQRGPYHAVWRMGRTLTGGPMRYAYSTLGLVPFSAIGPGIAKRQQLRETTPNTVMQTQAVYTAGIALQQGQVFGQPLLDPNAPGSGYSDPLTPLGNVPYPRFDIAPAGAII